MNAYVACHGRDEAHAGWFLICDCCGDVEEVSGATADGLKAIRRESGFEIQTFEAHGHCQRCQK